MGSFLKGTNMNHYIQHIKSLYRRPILNGIDGNMELRSASPFELFLDLIFVIALSKLAFLLELQTGTGFLEATLLFMIIYSLWHTMTTYTVMFMKKETNYWTRAMVFIVMVPLIFFLSIQNFDDHFQVMVFCFSLALSKIFLALIFRDSIINAPLNNIVMSNLYMTTSRSQLISAFVLLVAAFITIPPIFISLLIFVALQDVVLIPLKRKKIIKNSFAPLLLNKQLFMERQLLFIILIFGESLISIINNIASDVSPISIVHIILAFSIMFLFYVRISEETEHNSALIETANNLSYWLLLDYVIFVLFFIISITPELIEHHGTLPIPYLILLVCILTFITTEHFHLNLQNLKLTHKPVEKIYYKLDNKLLSSMYAVIILIIFFHGSTTILYTLLLIFFLLHVFALPFRSHLIEEKCSLATHLNENE